MGHHRLEAPDRPPIETTADPCRHGPPLSHPITGDVIGFALRWDDQNRGVLWISGDTVLYDGVRQVAGRVEVDLALLHLGGVRFPITGPLRYTMTAADAIELCQLIRPHTVIPVHYES
jgi:L-ascorbate metabolism protein UlaG (beta-lactamase superfamily)